MKPMKCKVCKSKMNIYRMPDIEFKSTVAVGIYKMGTAVCPRCFNMVDLEGDEEARK
jgi:hypothetical protein